MNDLVGRGVSMELLDMEGVTYCEFKKGSNIIRQGEKVDFLYYLISGTCFRIIITDNGEEIIYGIKESNNSVQSLLGVLALFTTGLSVTNFVARSKCCCYKIPKETFLQYIQDKPLILSQLLHMSMDAYRELVETFQARKEGRVANRLCKFLLNNTQNYHGILLVNRIFSNAEISRFLGIHKVTVAKILRQLKNQGIIIKEREGIKILNKKLLESYAEDEKTLDYF